VWSWSLSLSEQRTFSSSMVAMLFVKVKIVKRSMILVVTTSMLRGIFFFF